MAIKPIPADVKTAAAMPLSQDDAIKLVTLNVEFEFQRASEAFLQSPNASNNWQRLETAMYAHQFWRQTKSFAVIEKLKLLDIGIGYWCAAMAKYHKESF